MNIFKISEYIGGLFRKAEYKPKYPRKNALQKIKVVKDWHHVRQATWVKPAQRTVLPRLITTHVARSKQYKVNTNLQSRECVRRRRQQIMQPKKFGKSEQMRQISREHVELSPFATFMS